MIHIYGAGTTCLDQVLKQYNVTLHLFNIVHCENKKTNEANNQ